MEWIKHLLEYIGGEVDTPPAGLRLPLSLLTWGIWWGILACAIMILCGQSSKFIYIDFEPMITTRRFFFCLALALGVLATFNVFIALKVDSVPKLKMRQMRAIPKIDILFLGSSVVEYGFDEHAFAAAWPAPNPVPPFYDAALSSSSPVEHYLLGRDAYLHHKTIRCLVYGFYDHNLTEPPGYTWTKLVGNKAMGYSPEYATLAASLYAPGSTWEKWRFNLIGAVPMLREHSQLWKFIELFRRQLKQIGMPKEKTAPYGRVADFDVYPFPDVGQFSRDSEDVVQHAAPFIPPVEQMIQLGRKDKSRVVIVEMPMISDHRNRLYATQGWQDYRAYLQKRCEAEGATYVNASDWVPDDANFNDNLHLNRTGREDFQREDGRLFIRLVGRKLIEAGALRVLPFRVKKRIDSHAAFHHPR